MADGVQICGKFWDTQYKRGILFIEEIIYCFIKTKKYLKTFHYCKKKYYREF